MTDLAHYKVVNIKGITYTYMLIEGGNFDVSRDYFTRDFTDTNFFKELPDDFIVGNAKLSVAFEDDLPIGLAIASELKLEVNLSAIDMTLANAVTNKNSLTNTRIVNGRNIAIPNLWLVWIDDELIFIGTQELRPATIGVSSDLYHKYSVVALGIEQGALKRVREKDLTNLTTYTFSRNNVDYINFNLAAYGNVRAGFGSEYAYEYKDQVYRFQKLSQLIEDVFLEAQKYYRALLRRPQENFTNTSYPYSNWTFYNTQTNDKDQRHSVAIASSPNVMTEIDLNGNTVKSLFEEIELNAYDFIKYLTEESLMIGTTELGTNKGLRFGTIKGVRLIQSAIDTSKFIEEFTWTDNYKVISTSEVANKSLGDGDSESIIMKNDLPLKDVSYDVETIFHNRNITLTNFDNQKWYGKPNFRMFYNSSPEPAVKLNEYCKVNLGDVVIESPNYTEFDFDKYTYSRMYSNKVAFYRIPNEFRAENISSNFVINKALHELFSFGKNILIETKMPNTEINILQLGELYTIDTSILYGYTYLQGYCKPVSIDMNLENGNSIVKLFVW